MALPTAPRLTFRCWCEEDLPLAMQLWSNADVMRYLGGPMTDEEVRARLQLEIDRERAIGIQYWPIFETATGDFAGCAGLKPFHDDPGVFEVGAHIMRRFWSGRFGEEAARAAIRFGFEHMNARELTAGHNPANLHSKALVERLGFAFSHLEPWGKSPDLHLFYRLAQPEQEV